MFRNKTKLIYHTDKPVLATFAVSFLEHSETQIRQVAAQQDRSYKSLLSACRQGLAWKSLLPAFSTALDAAVYEAVATDTTDSSNKLREESMKHNLKHYITMA